MVCYNIFPFYFISNSVISLSYVISVSILSTSITPHSYFQILCYICFQFLVILQSISSESVISISIFVLPDLVISNSYSVISDLYYLIPLYQSPLYQKDHPRKWTKKDPKYTQGGRDQTGGATPPVSYVMVCRKCYSIKGTPSYDTQFEARANISSEMSGAAA